MRLLWIGSIILFLSLNANPSWSGGEPVSVEPSLTKQTETETLKQLKICSKSFEKQNQELGKCQNELTKCKSSKETWVEKIGLMAIGAGVAYTQFNVLSLLAAGYLIIFQ